MHWTSAAIGLLHVICAHSLLLAGLVGIVRQRREDIAALLEPISILFAATGLVIVLSVAGDLAQVVYEETQFMADVYMLRFTGPYAWFYYYSTGGLLLTQLLWMRRVRGSLVVVVVVAFLVTAENGFEEIVKNVVALQNEGMDDSG